ncbi:amidohydrolase [Sphingomonas paeninsulae]|uniref:Amidohydrolase n=1 Tax=Sphingomonas paeninsulae TaxID=2319844 RepID=A0A494TQN2_SPHPE|nr:amidohydrolase [Sphingomonas paeninsulae]AYJ87415.1 amidohydrolase [Sphingomonas paeninsulae]
MTRTINRRAQCARFLPPRLRFRHCLALAIIVATPALADGWVDNVNGVTLDAQGKIIRFTGLTVTPDGKVGKLVQRGDKAPERPDWKLDGKGQTLLPGMIDAHGHVMELGFSALTLDLSDTTSLDQAKAKITAYAAAHPDRHWILGGGWNQEKWQLGRFPTAADLNGLAGDRPIWLSRVDGHAGWANTAAMSAAGVTATTKAPAGGRIESVAGKPTGVFVDAATALIAKAIPAPTSKDRDLAFAKAQDILLGFGITGIADMGTTLDDWNTYRRAGDTGRLAVRIYSYAFGIEPTLTIAAGEPTSWLYADHLRMVGVKFYADGALGSRGACLKKPYADKPGDSGLCFMDDAKMKNLMSRAAMDGFQVAIHAIGDRANDEVLTAIEDLAPTYKGDRRWRIEHAQIVDPVDLPRFGKNGIVASMQPVHQTSDRTMAEARLGAARLPGAYAWKSMLANGAHLAFGSDTPVESPNPFPGIAAAISREGADGQPFGGWQPQEIITREQALAAFTTGAAYAAFAEDRVGRLAPGFRADFILVDHDPLDGPPASVRATKVAETWIGGKRVFRK